MMKNIFTPLLILLCVFLVSCKDNGSQIKSSLSKEDSIKIQQWDILFADTSAHKDSVTFNREISPDYSEACIKKYEELYKNIKPDDVEKILKSYTKYISFALNGDDDMSQIPDGSTGKRFIMWYLGCAMHKEFNHLTLSTGIYVDPSEDPKHNNYGLDPSIANYIKEATRKNGTTPLIGAMTVFMCPWTIQYIKTPNGIILKDKFGHRIIDTANSKHLQDPTVYDFNLGDLQP